MALSFVDFVPLNSGNSAADKKFADFVHGEEDHHARTSADQRHQVARHFLSRAETILFRKSAEGEQADPHQRQPAVAYLDFLNRVAQNRDKLRVETPLGPTSEHQNPYDDAPRLFRNFLEKHKDELPSVFSGHEPESVRHIFAFCEQAQTAESAENFAGLKTGLGSIAALISQNNGAYALNNVEADAFCDLRNIIRFLRKCRDQDVMVHDQHLGLDPKAASVLAGNGYPVCTDPSKVEPLTKPQVDAAIQDSRLTDYWIVVPDAQGKPLGDRVRIDAHQAELLANKGCLVYSEHRPGGDDRVLDAKDIARQREARRPVRFFTPQKEASPAKQEISRMASDILIDIAASQPWTKDLALGRPLQFSDVERMRMPVAVKAPVEPVADVQPSRETSRASAFTRRRDGSDLAPAG